MIPNEIFESLAWLLSPQPSQDKLGLDLYRNEVPMQLDAVMAEGQGSRDVEENMPSERL
jgi:hypothetical protein